MKRLILLTLSISLLFFACSDKSGSENVTNAVAEFQVEGMVCEMGCGASLRKGLYETGFVSEVKVDYAEKNPSNAIKIYFDNRNLTTDRMEDIIESLNENQFNADLINVEELSSTDQKKYKEKQSDSSTKPSGVKASTESFSIPNLTELLNSLIH